jgi:hypothetical protein
LHKFTCCRQPYSTFHSMTKFISNQQNIIRPVLRGWGIFISLCIAILLILTLAFNYKIKDTSYYVLIFLFLIQVGRDLITDRIYEIRFDQNTKQIDFFFKRCFFYNKQKSLSFDTAKIVTTNERTGIFGTKNSKAIHFLNKQTLLLKVNTDKDGFSKDTLDQICITSEQNLISISGV